MQLRLRSRMVLLNSETPQHEREPQGQLGAQIKLIEPFQENSFTYKDIVVFGL